MSLHFYSTHQGTASLDNVKFAAKQLEAQAVTIEPDGENSLWWHAGKHVNTDTGAGTHTGAVHPPTCAQVHSVCIFTISMQAISSESAGVNC